MVIRFINTFRTSPFDVTTKGEYMAAVQVAAREAKNDMPLVCAIKLPATMGGWAPVPSLEVPLGYWGAKAKLVADWQYLLWYETRIKQMEGALLQQIPGMEVCGLTAFKYPS